MKSKIKYVVVIVMGIMFPECLAWMKEVAAARIRAIQQVFYVEEVKIAEGVSREEMVVDVPQSLQPKCYREY